MKSVFLRRAARAFALAFALSSLVSSRAFAQGSALPPGVAAAVNEAPGAPLAVPSGMSATVEVLNAPGSPAQGPARDPAAERSMAFTANGGQCRDTVPGGVLLVLAYAAVLTLLGVYVMLLAVKNVRLAQAVRDLEREVLKRAPATDEPPSP